jgi:UPF0042 nucleotide-binding protein
MAKKTDIIILSGLSGSGKSTALRTLEDLGFFCVDNLPILLLPMFIELCQSSSFEISRVALVMDVRERNFLKDFKHTYEKLLREHHTPVLIFLECEDAILVQRFSETRRQHPLSEGGTVLDGITRERSILREIKSMSDYIVDTSEWNIHELKKTIEDYFQGISKREMNLTLLSFGFKYGVPHEADIVIDVRFMPNPHFVPELKSHTGNEDSVMRYVVSRPEAREFVDRLCDFLSFQLPLFEREGKSYLTVAIGCTGGRHRSVAVVNMLRTFFLQHRPGVYAQHRDIDKE